MCMCSMDSITADDASVRLTDRLSTQRKLCRHCCRCCCCCCVQSTMKMNFTAARTHARTPQSNRNTAPSRAYVFHTSITSSNLKKQEKSRKTKYAKNDEKITKVWRHNIIQLPICYSSDLLHAKIFTVLILGRIARSSQMCGLLLQTE